ncbi:Zim17p [Sporobolomyces salmoneus]|uniref:Zim17p n=1 Tax=Sporobolomyces salmoneus TaxID=183962 RepID=UPI003172434D
MQSTAMRSLLRSCTRQLATRSIPRPSPLPRLLPSSLSSFPSSSRYLSTSPYRYEAPLSTGTPIGRIDRKLRIIFTCTAPIPEDPQQTQIGAPAKPCGHRSSHEFSKRSYDKGVVIVQCPECSNRHLIADHLQWFSQTPSPQHPTGQPIGKETPRTIEDIMREKGEQVKWIDEGDQGATLEVPPPVEEAEVDGGKN